MNYNINTYIDDTGFTSVNYDDFSNSIDIDLNLTSNDDLKTTFILLFFNSNIINKIL